MSAGILGRESFVSHMHGSLGEQMQPAAEKSAKAGARSGLDALFVPDSVAVIGATERPGTVCRTVLSNLTESRFRRKRMPSQLSQPRGSSLDRLRYPRLLIKSEQF